MTASHLSLTDIRGGYSGPVAPLRADRQTQHRLITSKSRAESRRWQAVVLLADDLLSDRPQRSTLLPDDAIRLGGLLPWLDEDEAFGNLLALTVLVDEMNSADQLYEDSGTDETLELLEDARDAVRKLAIKMVRADEQAAHR